MPTNIDIINAIRDNASADFKARIPEATQDNVIALGDAILEFKSGRNEFVDAIVDRIAFAWVSSRNYKNPLAMFNKGKIPYGKTIEEIHVDLLEAQTFSPETAENEIFKRVKPPVSAIFHELNRQDRYKVTVSIPQLRLAFLNPEGGLNDLVSGLIQSMTNSDEQDQFLLTKNLFNIYATAGRFYPVTVPPAIDDASIRQIMVQIKAMSNYFTFMDTKYNDANVNTHAPKVNQVILIDPLFDAQVDVELLAQAFNMSRADFEARKVVTNDFGGVENVLCMIVDEDWFQIYDNLYETESIYNGEGLYMNYWLHHWQTFSVSRFKNSVIFQTTTPTVTAVDVTPATATVAKKGSQQFEVSVTGTNNPPAKCNFEVDGTDSYISPLGLLYVGANETVSPLTVTATNVFNPAVSDTATVTVV